MERNSFYSKRIESWDPEIVRLVKQFMEEVARLRLENLFLGQKLKQSKQLLTDVKGAINDFLDTPDSNQAALLAQNLFMASSLQTPMPASPSVSNMESALDLTVDDKNGKKEKKKRAPKRKKEKPMKSVTEEDELDSFSGLKTLFIDIFSGDEEACPENFIPASRIKLTKKMDKKTREERDAFVCPNCFIEIFLPKNGRKLSNLKKHLRETCSKNKDLRMETKAKRDTLKRQAEDEESKAGGESKKKKKKRSEESISIHDFSPSRLESSQSLKALKSMAALNLAEVNVSPLSDRKESSSSSPAVDSSSGKKDGKSSGGKTGNGSETEPQEEEVEQDQETEQDDQDEDENEDEKESHEEGSGE